MGEDGVVTASVDVTNTGARAGDEIAQLYVGFPGAKVDRPVKLLRGFERVALEPGQTKRVSFRLSVRDLAYYDVPSRSWKVEPMTYTVLAGPSSRAVDLLSTSLTVTESVRPIRSPMRSHDAIRPLSGGAPQTLTMEPRLGQPRIHP